MNTRDQLLIRKVAFQNGHVAFTFRSGRTLIRDLVDFPILARATPATRAHFQLADRGAAVTWPQLDEEIGAAQVLGVPEARVAVASGEHVRRVDLRTLKLEGERKQEIVDDIAELIGRKPRKLGPGSKELRAMLVDIVEALKLDVSLAQSKPSLAEAIVREAGLHWTPDCDSRRSRSGGGSTITRKGLQRLRDAVERLVHHD